MCASFIKWDLCSKYRCKKGYKYQQIAHVSTCMQTYVCTNNIWKKKVGIWSFEASESCSHNESDESYKYSFEKAAEY